MKIVRGVDQKSWEWFCQRAGKITASGITKLVTDKLAVRAWKTEMPNSYLHLKLAEAWRGCPQEDFGGNRQTDQGVFNEAQARSVYTALRDCPVEQIAGCESHDGRLWCSPDGWLRVGVPAEAEGNVGLEIKCPNGPKHIGYLLDGGVPEEYLLQVQFSMFVTGAKEWHFFSYCRDLPEHFAIAERNEEIMEVISAAVSEFIDRFDERWKRLCELNGGPPARDVKPPAPRGFGATHIESDEKHPQHVFDDIIP